MKQPAMLIAALMMLTGCGLKGDLYLEEAAPAEELPQSANTEAPESASEPKPES